MQVLSWKMKQSKWVIPHKQIWSNQQNFATNNASLVYPAHYMHSTSSPISSNSKCMPGILNIEVMSNQANELKWTISGLQLLLGLHDSIDQLLHLICNFNIINVKMVLTQKLAYQFLFHLVVLGGLKSNHIGVLIYYSLL